MDAEWFWSLVDVCGENECWLWQGSVQTDGYGRIIHPDGSESSARRSAFAFTHGREPRGLIRHSCADRRCCNPNHLRDGTRTEREIAESFWSKVQVGGLDECWPFTGCKPKQLGGYGVINRGKFGEGSAHRAAFRFARRPIPDGLCVLHECDNPPCCNPMHLFLGTRGDNNRDREAKGRGGQAKRRGELNGRAQLTTAQVIELRRRASLGERPMRLAEQFGVSFDVAYFAIIRRTWKHVG